MASPSYLDDNKICFGDLEIELLTAENSGGPQSNTLFMYKSIGYIETYEKIKTEFGSFERILEIGVARGGGTAFLHRFFDARRVVGVDINPLPPVALEKYCAAAADAVRVHYGVSQADTERIIRIVEEEFSDGIDLVVDDASHAYEESKLTFEALFPYLRTGGMYIIEDWNWSHSPAAQQSDHFYAGRSALTNLVFELVMLHGGRSDIIDHIGLASSMAWVRRNWRQIPKRSFRIENYIAVRGRTFNPM